VLEIPAKPWVVGWWRDGVGAGSDSGTAVLVAHLDSREYGVGPFARATDLRRGDRMTLTAGAAELTYEVAAVETYLKERLPYERLFDQSGPPRVVLVTCGGEYRRDAGGWDSNVVVTFTPA
jgi:sortase (surface protein transpeptidase)